MSKMGASDRNSINLAEALALAGVCLLTLVVYWPGLGGGFVFDDISNLVENSRLHVRTAVWSDWVAASFSSPATELRRPLAMFTFALNHYFTGLDPWPMKLTNVGIHITNGILVFGLSREIMIAASEASQVKQRWVPLFVASFWMLAPINVMGVLYVVQRMESLSHFFVFSGLWAYVWLRRKHGSAPKRLVAAAFVLALASTLGVLAKESAVLTPLYAYCLELTVLRRYWPTSSSKAPLRYMFVALLWVPASIALAVLLPRALHPGAYASRDFGMADRLLTESRVLVDYFQWILLPRVSQLALHHDDYLKSTGLLTPPTTALSILAISTLVAAAFFLRSRRPLFSCGVLLYFSAHIITGSFLPLELVFEHRNYFATLGVALVVVDVLCLISPEAQRRAVAPYIGSLLVLYAASVTWIRSTEWSDPVRFVLSEAAKKPTSPRATYEKARILIILTGYDRSSRFDQQAIDAIEAAMKVPGASVLPAQAALIFASRTGRPLRDDWWDALIIKLRSQPIGPHALGALGALVKCSNMKECDFPQARMLEAFAAALSRGDHPEVLNIYGDYALSSLSDPKLAADAWNHAIQSKPAESQYRANMARLLIATGRPGEARLQIEAIRSRGRFGENERLARELEAELPMETQ